MSRILKTDGYIISYEVRIRKKNRVFVSVNDHTALTG